MATKLPGDSFMFGKYNSLLEWGIKVIAYDSFSASKRDRSITIPFVDGEYDYGEKNYQSKIIRLDCCTETKELTKSDMREVIYHMSQQNRLILWDEPDKHYIGELLDSADVQVLPKRIKQQFTLSLKCRPFAYRDLSIIQVTAGIIPIQYKGTAKVPTLIVLKNKGTTPISSITITTTTKSGG